MHGSEYRGKRSRRQRPCPAASLVAMRTTSLRVLAGFASVCVVVGIAALATSPATAAASCEASIVPPTGAPGDLLLAVTGEPGAAVAVGIHFDGGTGRPLVVRQVAGQWQRVMIPIRNGAGTIQLQDAVTVGDRTWAVGVLRNEVPMAGWLQGDRWRWSTPIDPGGTEDEFLGVTLAEDGTLWAVGKHQQGHDYQPLIQRYDGSAWHVVASPVVSGSAVLKDIAAAADGTLWAVGWSVHDGGVTVPLIERWNGSAWVVEPTAGSGLLSGVAVDAEGVATAVGWDDSMTPARPIAFASSGGVWAALTPPAPSGRLTSVLASVGAVIAVGTVSGDTGIPQPLLVRGIGSTWSTIPPTENPSLGPVDPGGDVLNGVAGTADAFLAVGTRDTAEPFGSLVVSGGC